MSLISSLQEASSHSLQDLKKVVSKDARVKSILQKHLDIDEINKAEFLSTAKFFIFNNPNVMEFVKERTGVKNIHKWDLVDFRKLKLSEFDQLKLNQMRLFVADLFAEHNYVQNDKLSASTRKDLTNWANGNSRFFDLTSSTQRELVSVLGVRPDKPIVLYRGLLFKSFDLKERKRYDGELDVGKGLKFLKSVREGTRIVDLEWDRLSSWSISRETAMNFAKFGPANSNFTATMQWLTRAKDNNAIDGDLGFIISTLAQPEDILIDMNRFNPTGHQQHGSEAEIILKPGEYTCRVNTKYTKEGEVDPTIKSSNKEVSKAVQEAKKFLNEWTHIDTETIKNNYSHIRVESILSREEMDSFSELMSKELQDKVIQSFSELKRFYEEHLTEISGEDLSEALASQKDNSVVQWLSDVKALMNSKIRISRDSVIVKDLDPKKYYDLSYTLSANDFKNVKSGARFTESRTGNILSALLTGLTGERVRDIHKMKGKDQQAIVDKVISAYHKNLNIPETDRETSIDQIIASLKDADQTGHFVDLLDKYQSDLQSAVSRK